MRVWQQRGYPMIHIVDTSSYWPTLVRPNPYVLLTPPSPKTTPDSQKSNRSRQLRRRQLDFD
jgi:hypothetical protein